jgi:hypothetical protein
VTTKADANDCACCEYFQAALDPNILRAYSGYCKANEWPFTLMVPKEGLGIECTKPAKVGMAKG